MTKFDRMLGHLVNTPDDEEETLSILDGFGRYWEVTPRQWHNFSGRPPTLFLGARPFTADRRPAQT